MLIFRQRLKDPMAFFPVLPVVLPSGGFIISPFLLRQGIASRLSGRYFHVARAIFVPVPTIVVVPPTLVTL
jgi:hypothetical protein